MAHGKHHDIWSGSNIEYYSGFDKQPRCTICIHFERCERSQKGKSICSVFAAGRRENPKDLAGDWVNTALRGRCSFVDKRGTGGYLWVPERGKKKSRGSLNSLMREMAMRGAVFEHRDTGSPETDNRTGWFLWGFPKEKKTGKAKGSSVKKPKGKKKPQGKAAPRKELQAPSKYGKPKRQFEFGTWEDEHGAR